MKTARLDKRLGRALGTFTKAANALEKVADQASAERHAVLDDVDAIRRAAAERVGHLHGRADDLARVEDNARATRRRLAELLGT